jgi:hypothetical protein
MFRARGGLRHCPRGVIQSSIGPLRLFVSSDLALETPFCNCHIIRKMHANSKCVAMGLPFRQCEQRPPHLWQGAGLPNPAQSEVKSQTGGALAAAYDEWKGCGEVE